MQLILPQPRKLILPPTLADRKLTELPDVPRPLYAHGGGAMPHSVPSGAKQAAAGGGGGSFGVTFVSSAKDSTGATSLTGMSLGAADTNRYMLAVGFARHNSSNLILSGCTVAGAGTTAIYNSRRDGTADSIAFAFYTAALTSGTSGTVALTFGTGTPQFISCALYRVVTTGAAPTFTGTGVVGGSGSSSTGSITRDTTGTTPFVVYGCMFSDEASVLTPGGTALTSPVADYVDTWTAPSASFGVWSDSSPGVGASVTLNCSSTVSTVWVHGATVVTP